MPASQAPRKLPLLCVRVAGWQDKVCTTHLVAGNDDVALRQAQFIREELADEISSGLVLAGDFNRSQKAAALAPIADGLGRCDNGDHTYQYWGGDSATASRHRLDHVFTTRRARGPRFVNCVVDQSRMDTTQNTGTDETSPPNGYSDHAPVIAYLRDAPVPGDMTGDGGVPGVHDGIGLRGWTGASVAARSTDTATTSPAAPCRPEPRMPIAMASRTCGPLPATAPGPCCSTRVRSTARGAWRTATAPLPATAVGPVSRPSVEFRRRSPSQVSRPADSGPRAGSCPPAFRRGPGPRRRRGAPRCAPGRPSRRAASGRGRGAGRSRRPS